MWLWWLALQYQEDVDLGFPGGLVCALLLLLLMGGVQAVVLPRTKILLLLFLTAFIWVAVILILLLAVRYKKDLFYLTEKSKCLLLQTSMHRLGSQPILFTSPGHLYLHRDPHLHHGPSQHVHLQRRLLWSGLRRMRSPGNLSPHLSPTPIHSLELHVGIFSCGRLPTHANNDQKVINVVEVWWLQKLKFPAFFQPVVMRYGLGLCPFNRIKS